MPVLNEAAQIGPFLRHLRARAVDAEIIVVDGSSDDDTAELARRLCDTLIVTERGRPAQLNAGANLATGSVLWFLHADNEITDVCCQAIMRAMEKTEIAGGCFRVRIPRPEWVYRIHDGLAHYVGRLLRVRCGDHGIFVRKDVFEAIGGFSDVPLMEDVQCFRSIACHGRLAWLRQRLLLSARRHQQVGVYRYTFVCAAIVALYCLGFSPHRLARVYSRLIPSRDSARCRPLEPVEPEIFAGFRADLGT